MQYFIFFLCGLLGVLFHSIMKCNSLKQQAKAANMPFKVKDYLSEDYLALGASFVSVFIWLLLFAEAAEKYPAVETYARLSFVLMGAIGSYILQYFFSAAQKKITKVIDEKTNELDAIKKP